MRKRIEPWFVVVLALIAIGIGSYIYNGSRTLIIPIVLVAIVFLLYKFPPNRWTKTRSNSYDAAAARSKRKSVSPLQAKPTKRRSSPFTVIEGNKDKNDDPPRYH
ncbi:MAG: hypothetical protein P0Y55_05915 [Candidatus Cohnella colombiensis]|uniref:Uncharacterized protein n=1 Tax=Candidatus Cohnella colombiensis TaxID=3121368 RepID=A0AA95JGQ0_9BACL|nr:MAG: hypothetical protein P0Y55_05915 [Cohnella sp.]